MKEKELSIEEIRKLIRDITYNETKQKLDNFYSYKTIWEILKQSRKESSHTYFLAWFFNCADFNSDLNNGAVKKLLVLLLEYAELQGKYGKYKDLADSFYSGNLKILSCFAVPEYRIDCSNITSNRRPNYGEGSIDILITLQVELNTKDINNTQPKRINIVIENKIDAPETTKLFDNKFKKIDDGKNIDATYTLYQTDAYFEYINNVFPGDTNIYVYLKPDGSNNNNKMPECNCKEYIQINYQQLLNKVIEPIFNREDISKSNKDKLFDYIRALSKPSESEKSNKTIIMATPNEEKKLLENFFNENEDLIRATIAAINDPTLTAALNNLPKGKKNRTKYTIKYTNGEIPNIPKSHLAKRVVEAYIKCKSNCTINDLNNVFGEIRTPFFEYNKGNDSNYDEITIGNTKLYINNQVWADKSSAFENLKKKIYELSDLFTVIEED